MATEALGSSSSTASAASLDLEAILSSHTGECLLSAHLSFSSTSDSLHSLDTTPPFPSTAKPLIFLNDLEMSFPFLKTQPSSAVPSLIYDVTRPLVTLPTGPRLKVMLMEKISVVSWANSVALSCEPHGPSDQEGLEITTTDAAPCSAGDSLVVPKILQDAPRDCSGGMDDVSTNTWPKHIQESIPDATLADSACSTAPPTYASVISTTISGDPTHVNATGMLGVPTIMVSNSIAALPMSLESSYNLQQGIPLAVRRGKKPPPSLSLGQPRKPETNGCPDDDPYPDIPSAFLGSPTGHSPTSPFFSGKPSEFDMGLSAMCSNLKALVPPPFSPTESNLPPRTNIEPETRWGMVNTAQLPASDEEEWAFVQDLVVEWHVNKGLRAEISPPPSPADDIPNTAAASQIVPGGSPAATKTEHSRGDNTSAGMEETELTQTPESVKRARRKTVLIQTPDVGSCVDEARIVDKIDKLVIVRARDRSADLLPDEFDEPVPFETPVFLHASSLVSTDSTLSTPCSSRPPSTASARLPTRGILKEKKSVRFSAVPDFHEFVTENHGQRIEHHGVAHIPHHINLALNPHSKNQPDSAASPSANRAPMAATPYKSSPLRASHAAWPDRSGAEEDAAIPAPARSFSLFNAGSPSMMAKHPAVRALARRPASRRPLAPPALFVDSGTGCSILGVPELRPPCPNTTSSTPDPVEEEPRAPLKPINTRQNLSMEHKQDMLIPARPPSASPTKGTAPSLHATPGFRGKVNETIGRRGHRTASVPPTPRCDRKNDARRRSIGPLRGAKEKGEAACGETPAAQKTTSRMSVPLRNIFTKLRN